MKCPRCQQDNPPSAKFCLECGTPLKRSHDGGAQGESYTEPGPAGRQHHGADNTCPGAERESSVGIRERKDVPDLAVASERWLGREGVAHRLALPTRELNYNEGRNHRVEERWAEGDPTQLPGLARALVEFKATLAAKQATTTIPEGLS
jgi:hypothetical protein